MVLYDSAQQEKYFACCASTECYEESVMIKLSMESNEDEQLRWITSNPVRHLEKKHGIFSDASKKRKNKKVDEDEERHIVKMQFKGNRKRLCELQWVRMIMLSRLPLSFAVSKVVRDTMHYTCIDSMNLKLSIPRTIHLATEIYNQVLSVIKGTIAASIAAHGTRVFSINVDGWKPKNSTRKFVGLRLFFMDPEYALRTFLLAVREFDPSSEIREGKEGLRTCMRVWNEGILEIFGLTFKNIFGATTDGAGDVRILSIYDIMAYWEWCPPHMINRALIHAFGKRNQWMSDQLAEIKLVIKRLRDHTRDGSLFQEILEEENPEVANKNLHSYQMQRFMGVYLTFVRFHEMYESIQQMCGEAGILYEVKLTKIELEQLISLLAPLRDMSVKTQKTSEAYGFRYLQKICKERIDGSLNLKSGLKHFEEGQPAYITLSPRIIETRRLLIEAIDIKFFSRYFRKEDKSVELRQALMLEAQHLLHPAFRNLNIVHKVMAELVESESVALGTAWWKEKKKTARNNAINASRGKSRGKGSNAPLDEAIYARFLLKAKHDFLKQAFEKVESKVKQLIIDTIMDADPKHAPKEDEEAEFTAFEDQFARQAIFTGCTSVELEMNLERGGNMGSTMPKPAESKRARVRTQFVEYLETQNNVRAFSDLKLCLNIPKWMKEVGIFKYGLIALAIPYFFGMPTSSSGIELDFYFNSLILTKHRMSMRGEIAEMLHMVDRDQAKIDLAQVNQSKTI